MDEDNSGLHNLQDLYNILNEQLGDTRSRTESLAKTFIEYNDAFKDFYNLQRKSKNLSQEELDILDKKFEHNQKRLLIEKHLIDIKDKGVDEIQKEIKLEQEQLRIKKAQAKASLELASDEKEKLLIKQRLNEYDIEEENLQKRAIKLDKDREISANKIFNLSKEYKKIWSSITDEKKKQAELANQDLDRMIYLRDKGLATDEDVDSARRKAQVAADNAELADQFKTIVDGIVSKIGAVFKSMDQAIQRGVDTYSKYMGKVDARLQAITESKTFNSIYEATDKLLKSPLLDYSAYLDVIDQLSSQGISYNIEERAFLETISDKVVASFSSLDATLLRMTRLQQADMTRLMLGNEATLTRLFNEFFEDSSYLATNVSDNISASVFEAASTMNQAAASAFEFTVQKWLGALYEVGVSQETVSSIASAINALGSGNAQSFMSSPVAVLLNMAIARGDYSLSDVLTQGLNTEFIDDMMTSMVTLLKDIKNNTTNQVTLQAYSNVLGMSMSDVRGFANLTENDIATLAGYSQDANAANSAVENQIRTLVTRTSIKERIDNKINNFLLEKGIDLGKREVSYTMYLLADIVADLAGDSVVGNAAQAVKLAQMLASNDITFDDVKSIDLTSMFYKGAIGFINGFQDLWDFIADEQNGLIHIGMPGSSGLISLLGSSNPYVRYNRGQEFTGVSPDYGANYGKISTNVSNSLGITSSNRTSNKTSLDAIYSANTESEAASTTKQRIENLQNNAANAEIQFFSRESAQALEQQVSLSDFYREIFEEQNFPLKVHFDAETQSFLDAWSSMTSKIFDRQHDTHVTNTVGVTGSVNVSGSVSVEGGGYEGSSYNAFYNNRHYS